MTKELVDWSEPVLVRWMGTITRENTKATYRSGYKLYAFWTGKTATFLIDEALEDRKRDPREKTDVVKQRLINFYHWLVTKAPKKQAVGRGKAELKSEGLSPKMAHCYVSAVRSFYGTFDIYVALKGRSRLPKPKVLNKRLIVNNMEVKKLVDNARSPRDRAIILTLFQGGLDVSTLCDLKYGDVAEGLSKNEYPIKLDLYRPKTGIEYYTFLGKDSCDSIRAYLNDVKSRGLKHMHNDPLFLKESNKALTKEKLSPNLVQTMMREIALKAEFIDAENNGRDFNPLSPHALRESFGSIMINKGVPDSIVDFWLGHEIGEMAEAYKRVQYGDLKRMYVEHEAFINITQPESAFEQKVRAELDKQNRELQSIINGLISENLELRERTSKAEEHIEKIERNLMSLKSMIEKLSI